MESIVVIAGIVVGIWLFIWIVDFFNKANNYVSDSNKIQSIVRERDELKYQIETMQRSIKELSIKMFSELKEKEIEKYKKTIENRIDNDYKNQFIIWKDKFQKQYRDKAFIETQKDHAALAELVYHNDAGLELSHFDAVYVGDKLDMIVFDGLTDGFNEIKIYGVGFVRKGEEQDIYTKRIKNAFLHGRTSWVEIEID